MTRKLEAAHKSQEVKLTRGDGSGSREKSVVRIVASPDRFTAASSGGGRGGGYQS